MFWSRGVSFRSGPKIATHIGPLLELVFGLFSGSEAVFRYSNSVYQLCWRCSNGSKKIRIAHVESRLLKPQNAYRLSPYRASPCLLLGSAPTFGMFVWLVADGWCWFVLREKYC
jgi:hypothetical protein